MKKTAALIIDAAIIALMFVIGIPVGIGRAIVRLLSTASDRVEKWGGIK